jgi:hypothetical protein
MKNTLLYKVAAAGLLLSTAAYAEGTPHYADSTQTYEAHALYGTGVYLCSDIDIATRVMHEQYQYIYWNDVIGRQSPAGAEKLRLGGYGRAPIPPEDYGCVFVPNGTLVTMHFPTGGMDVDLANGAHLHGIIVPSQLAPVSTPSVAPPAAPFPYAPLPGNHPQY